MAILELSFCIQSSSCLHVTKIPIISLMGLIFDWIPLFALDLRAFE